jgi:hypothetical protein
MNHVTTISRREPHSRSLEDAISLVRNRHDQGTVYYRKDGVLGVYDVCPRDHGTMYVNGRALTYTDIPQDWKDAKIAKPTDLAIARNLETAINVFKHNSVDVTTGWDIKP